MSTVERDGDAPEAPRRSGMEPLAAVAPSPVAGADPGPRQVLFRRRAKHFVKGVTYGPFAAGTHGAQFPERAMVERDFALMRGAGDQHRAGLHGAAGLAARSRRRRPGSRCWSGCRGRSMSRFSTAPTIKTEIRAAVAAGVRACGRHPAVFAYLVGNEIPPDMIRWHGADAVRRVPASELVALVRQRAPGGAGQLRQFPVDRISDHRFHRFPVLQRLSARRDARSAAISPGCTIWRSTSRWC